MTLFDEGGVIAVPGWCVDKARESYHDNLDFFRPGRKPQA
jgi:hypothetical protein